MDNNILNSKPETLNPKQTQNSKLKNIFNFEFTIFDLFRISRLVFRVFIICYFCLSVVPLFAQDKIIAIVNSDVITQKDMDDFLNFARLQLGSEYAGKKLEEKVQAMKMDLLDKLIEDRIILQEAKKAGIRVDENRVKGKIDEIRRHYPSDREFQATLRIQGIVQADLEAKARDQMLMYNMVDTQVRSKIIIKPAEVTDFYQKHPEEFKTPQEWEFSALALESKDKAVELFSALKKGSLFGEIADKNALMINKLKVKQGDLKKDVEDSILKLKVQEVSSPIKIEEKFYIFKLDNVITPRQESLAQAQDAIFSFLFNKRMQEDLTKWLDGLKQKSYIKIL